MKEETNTNAELILITGDFHIPHRIQEIPEDIKKVFAQKNNKFSHVLCTGNVVYDSYYKEGLDWLRSLSNNFSNFHIVKSENSFNLDEKYDEIKTVKIGDFIISIINGYQIVPWNDIESLSSIQKQTGCDILISGYTHIPQVVTNDGKYYVNPGSLTGAYSALIGDPSPSFMILAISGDCGILYLYELNIVTKNFEITKLDINKNKSE
jgi:vacuolar protein sorting-associated protein 29